ncbi:hypothetical protein D3C84_744280 [compost metagenome]
MEFGGAIHGVINSRIGIDLGKGTGDVIGPGRDTADMTVVENPSGLQILGRRQGSSPLVLEQCLLHLNG